MKQSVVAVIVTYQRTELLVRCLESLLAQNRAVDRIILIDNNPDDSVATYLKSNGYLDSELYDYLHPQANIGGAGGFHEGMKRAHELGFDWIWLVDDDAYLAPDCLDQLMAVCDRYDVIGPIVCHPEYPDRLTWGYRRLTQQGYFAPRGHLTTLEALSAAAVNGCYEGYTNCFNGVLFRRTVFERLGYAMKELFCWGDEVEYFLRCKAANFRIATCLTARCYHPSPLDSMSPFKFYYRFRNTCYTYWKYANITYAPGIRFLYPIYIVMQYLRRLPSRQPGYLIKLLQGISAAFIGQLIPFERVSDRS